MIWGLVKSRLVTVLRRQIIAAAGDPVGRKANWSVKDRFGGETSADAACLCRDCRAARRRRPVGYWLVAIRDGYCRLHLEVVPSDYYGVEIQVKRFSTRWRPSAILNW